MNQTTFQPAEIYDSNGNIIQQGAFGINTPFCTSTGDGVYDYIINNLYALKDMIAAGYIAVATLPSSGQTNKYYVITEGANAGKCYVWTGSAWQELATQINGKSAYEIAVDHGFIGTEQQWLDSFTADAIAAANRAEAVQAQMEEKFSILDNVDARFANIEEHAEMTDSNVDATKKRISNVEKLLQGNLYDYQTDTDTAYTKTVPVGAMPYAGIEKLGGKTVVWNQLVQNGNFEDTTRWAHPYADIVVNNNILSATVTSVTTAGAMRIERPERYCPMITGHKYYATCMIYSPALISCMFQNRNVASGTDPTNVPANTWTRFDALYTCTNNSGSMLYYNINSGLAVGDTVQFKEYMVFDLTLMFGSGNEPTTVEEFQQMFPADYYEYNSGELLSAGVTEVVSKKADTTTIATYPVPAEVQALEGYGWSAGNMYNYIDYERKVFVKNVGSVDLGTLTWKAGNAGKFYATAPNQYKYTNNTQMVCAKYVFDGYGQSGTRGYYGDNKTIRYLYHSSLIYEFYIHDDSVSDVATLQASLDGQYLYYELATPVETDISAYLSDDNLIEVESDGTLTMYSDANGDDDAYHIPVPSTVEYMIDLNVATGGTENEP